MVKRCKTTGKVRFHDGIEAHLRISKSPWALNQRAYRCPDCGYWHLTKMDAKRHYHVSSKVAV